MTPLPPKTQHDAHSCFSPVLGQMAADTHRLNGHHMPKTGGKGTGIVMRLSPQKYGVFSQCNESAPSRAGRAPHREAGLQVQSRALCGVRTWGPNQQHGERCSRVTSGEHVFPTVHHKIETALPSRRALSGRARPQLSLRSARTSRSAPQNSGYPATASLLMKRSWLSWTNCDRASGLEMQHLPTAPLETTANVGNDRECKGSGPMMGIVTGGADPTNFCGGGAVAARLAHNQEVIGSSPIPATTLTRWLEGEPSECDGSAWDRLPPLILASGRARNRATCPAVARFNEGRVA